MSTCNGCDTRKLLQKNDIWIHETRKDSYDFCLLKTNELIGEEIEKIPTVDHFTEDYYQEERESIFTGKKFKIDDLQPVDWQGHKPPRSVWFSCGTWITNRFFDYSADDHENHQDLTDMEMIALHLKSKDDLVILDSYQAAIEFNQKYGCQRGIDWWKVKEDGFLGMILTEPKPESFVDFPEFDMELLWLYGYDTETLVIWDLSLLEGNTKAIKLVKNQ